MKIKTVGIILITSCLILPVTNIASTTRTIQMGNHHRGLIHFDSILEVSINDTALQNARYIPGGAPVILPIIIRTRADIPEFLFHGPFLGLKYFFLWGHLSYPFRDFKLTIENPPSWADVVIAPETLRIPLTTTWYQTISLLTIACHDDAPAVGNTLRLRADLYGTRCIDAKRADYDLILYPEWNLRYTVTTPSTNITTPPNQQTSVLFTITNTGNGQILITMQYPQIPGWSIYPEYSQITLPINWSTCNFLYLQPPLGFNGSQVIHLVFIAQPSPPQHEQHFENITIDLNTHYP